MGHSPPPGPPTIQLGGWSPSELVNDLEPPVVARFPAIGRLIGVLTKAGALYSAMSGSGSTVFGLFKTGRAANVGAAAVTKAGVRAIVTTTVDGETCRELGTPRAPG